MFIESISQLKSVTERSHFSIIVIPRNYGTGEVCEAICDQDTICVETDQEKGIYTAEIMREMQYLCRNKQAHRLTVVFRDSDLINEVGNNIFLKTLEEPTDNIRFIFITENENDLLPTVRSRAQVFYVNKISKSDSMALLVGVDPLKAQQILFLAEGLPGEIKKLLSEDVYFELKKRLINIAKCLVGGDDYKKILEIQKLKDDRTMAIEVLELSIIMLRSVLDKSPTNATIKKLASFEKAIELLEKKVNIRLAIASNVV
jgi:DNA polymerase III, gamma/tau subunits